MLCIKKINEIYASDVIISYIEKKRIEIFYERKQFLKKHSKLFYDAKDFMRTVLISVSYTHLDVYKRQEGCSPEELTLKEIFE